MAQDDDNNASPSPYVLGQLCRAVKAASGHPDPSVRQRALKRVEHWEQVFQGMLTGTLSVGTQAPVQDVPAWVTLEVVQGGFATGNLLAGGDLQPHELDLLAWLHRRPDSTARAALNIYYLSDSGQKDLCEMMRSGRYRINVPEEGVLLVVAWLLSHEMTEKAQELLDCITPFFDRLRFYPVPDENPVIPGPTVHRNTVGETVAALRAVQPHDELEAMREAITIWQPLYDRTVSLFLETVEDDHPCRTYPAEWRVRAQALLEEYTSLRTIYNWCRKPDRPKENFPRLRGYLKICIEDPARLSPRDTSMIRHILRCFVNRHGAPGSQKFAQRRAAQARIAELPTRDDLAATLETRLQQFPQNTGIENIDAVLSAIAKHESYIPADSKLHASLARKVRRCWNAPIAQLVEQGVIPSGDVLAQVLPQITSQVRAMGIADRDLRRLYSAVYSAFRHRRSLLLLNLERQVRLEDLPWIAALDSFRHDDLDSREQARQTLEQVTTIVLVSFPQAILPNKLLQELRALIATAGLSTPIVDELAADIFMGGFSEKFVRAAQIAAPLLRGTLYERYFGLSYERVQLLAPRQEQATQGYAVEVLRQFAALCQELACVEEGDGWSVSRNGKIIEQSQILTTQNLAPLFVLLDLHKALSGRLPELPRQCFKWICRRQSSNSWKANLRMQKNSAYAWRQMLFFLSFLDSQAVSAFLVWARRHLEQQNSSIRERIGPALSGLEWIAGGGTFNRRGIGGIAGEGRRFLGWTTGRQ
jgi:hypothetical protein